MLLTRIERHLRARRMSPTRFGRLAVGDPNLISWGYMVGAGRTVIRQAWWITVFPGVAILISVLGLNLIGEGLNDALNPRLSREGR